MTATQRPISMTLFNYDQRIRRVGYDIEWMMNAAGMNASMSPIDGEDRLLTPQAGASQG